MQKINGQSNNYVVEINDTSKICLGAEPSEVSPTSKVQQAVKGNALAEILDRLLMILMEFMGATRRNREKSNKLSRSY